MTREQEILLKMAKKALSADTNSDLISRANAIRWVKTECNQYGKPTLDYDSGLKVIEHLKKMPSEARAIGAWIPCSERLPKENEYVGDVCKYYLIQDEYGDMHVAHLSSRGWETIESVKALGCDVVAWMPLPKPYREESEVEE